MTSRFGLIILLLAARLAKSVIYSPLNNCTDACSPDLHHCRSCAYFLDACPEDLTSSTPPVLDLDPTTCYQTECSTGGCPEGEVEEPAHTPGDLCFTSDLEKCHTGVCRSDPSIHPCRLPLDNAFTTLMHCIPDRNGILA